MDVDVDGFNKSMQEQKDTARASRKEGSSWDGADNFEFDVQKATEFVGYFDLETEA